MTVARNVYPQNWGKNGGQGVWTLKLGSNKFNKKPLVWNFF